MIGHGYEGAAWFSLPGACPGMDAWSKTPDCTAAEHASRRFKSKSGKSLPLCRGDGESGVGEDVGRAKKGEGQGEICFHWSAAPLERCATRCVRHSATACVARLLCGDLRAQARRRVSRRNGARERLLLVAEAGGYRDVKGRQTAWPAH